MRLAEAYRSAGEHRLALRVLEEGTEHGFDHPAVHLAAARVHRDLDRADDERAALERTLEADPEGPAAREAMSRLEDPARGTGDRSPTESRTESPADPPADSATGSRPASHSPEERAEILEKLGEVARDDWWSGGKTSGEEGSSSEGSSREEDDDEEPVTETMARLYARQGLWEEAEALYAQLVERRPEDPRLPGCLEQVREREVPPRPPGARPEPPRERGDGGDPGGREVDPGDGPTVRAHLRALLRGGGARPVRRPREPDAVRPVAETVRSRPGEERDRQEGDRDREEGEMEELLRRWRRAARRGRDE